MAGRAQGTLDYRDDRFVARFAYDAAVVAEIKQLRRSAQKEDGEWVFERHRPSIAPLVRLGRDRGWHFTAAARRAIAELQEQAEQLRFEIDVAHGPHGEPMFYCMLGDDYELIETVKEIGGAYLDDADDSWWVPAALPGGRAVLLGIAQSDDRFEVSEQAWRLLDGSEEVYLPHGSNTSTVDDEEDELPDDLALGGVWEPTELDYQMHALSSSVREQAFKPALRDVLRPYQVAGVRYLSLATRAFLADELGLGKTLQALATIETLQAYPALVLCPAALQRTWLRESQRWLPEGKTIVALEGPSESVPVVDVLIVSYEQVARHQQLLADRPFETIVADESHLLKNREAQRTRAAIEIADKVENLRLCLSARPVGEPIDLAAQLEFLGVLESEFGGFWSYADRYCAPKGDGAGMRFGAARMDELAQRLRSTCYCRRTKIAVVAQLPEKSRALHWLELDERKRYSEVEEDAREALRALTGDAPAAQKARLEHVERVLHECGRQKTAAIARWVATFLSSGQPLVLFAQHRDVLSTLIESFPHAVSVSDGDDAAQRQQAVRAFQGGEAQLMICSTHAAGMIAVTRAAHVAFAEIAWSAATNEQVHRIGSEQGFTAWYLVGDDTIDALVLDVIAQKRVMAGQLHESVLLEVAQEIARMTEPRAPVVRMLPAAFKKIVG
ncbi:MAG TPA: SNF2-related protein [Polyangiales bacterium]|nr:SNF2-related protein [Polyangiales bacterium]